MANYRGAIFRINQKGGSESHLSNLLILLRHAQILSLPPERPKREADN